MCCNRCHSCSCGNTAIFPFYLPVAQANLTELYETTQSFQSDSSRTVEDFGGSCGCSSCNNSGCNCNNSCCGCGGFCCG